MKKNDEAHKEVLSKMEDSLSQAKLAYEWMMKGEADMKVKLENAQKERALEVSLVRSEVDNLKKKVEELEVMKAWFLSEGVRSLAKLIHKSPEMTNAIAAVNNAMSTIDENRGMHASYLHALKQKTQFREVPLLTKDAEAQLEKAISNFESLSDSGFLSISCRGASAEDPRGS